MFFRESSTKFADISGFLYEVSTYRDILSFVSFLSRIALSAVGLERPMVVSGTCSTGNIYVRAPFLSSRVLVGFFPVVSRLHSCFSGVSVFNIQMLCISLFRAWFSALIIVGCFFLFSFDISNRDAYSTQCCGQSRNVTLPNNAQG